MINRVRSAKCPVLNIVILISYGLSRRTKVPSAMQDDFFHPRKKQCAQTLIKAHRRRLSAFNAAQLFNCMFSHAISCSFPSTMAFPSTSTMPFPACWATSPSSSSCIFRDLDCFLPRHPKSPSRCCSLQSNGISCSLHIKPHFFLTRRLQPRICLKSQTTII